MLVTTRTDCCWLNVRRVACTRHNSAVAVSVASICRQISDCYVSCRHTVRCWNVRCAFVVIDCNGVVAVSCRFRYVLLLLHLRGLLETISFRPTVRSDWVTYRVRRTATQTAVTRRVFLFLCHRWKMVPDAHCIRVCPSVSEWLSEWVCALQKPCEHISKTNEGNYTQCWSQMYLDS